MWPRVCNGHESPCLRVAYTPAYTFSHAHTRLHILPLPAVTLCLAQHPAYIDHTVTGTPPPNQRCATIHGSARSAGLLLQPFANTGSSLSVCLFVFCFCLCFFFGLFVCLFVCSPLRVCLLLCISCIHGAETQPCKQKKTNHT